MGGRFITTYPAFSKCRLIRSPAILAVKLSLSCTRFLPAEYKSERDGVDEIVRISGCELVVGHRGTIEEERERSKNKGRGRLLVWASGAPRPSTSKRKPRAEGASTRGGRQSLAGAQALAPKILRLRCSMVN